MAGEDLANDPGPSARLWVTGANTPFPGGFGGIGRSRDVRHSNEVASAGRRLASKRRDRGDIQHGRGFTAGTLRWWASRLRREDTIAGSVVRLAQVVHAPPVQRDEVPRGTAVIELLDARVRITVASDTNRAVLAMVIDVLDRRGR